MLLQASSNYKVFWATQLFLKWNFLKFSALNCYSTKTLTDLVIIKLLSCFPRIVLLSKRNVIRMHQSNREHTFQPVEVIVPFGNLTINLIILSICSHINCDLSAKSPTKDNVYSVQLIGVFIWQMCFHICPFNIGWTLFVALMLTFCSIFRI